MKQQLFVGIMCLAAGTAFAYTDYPLYVVDVADNGVTNLLENATVQVYATAEADPVNTPFSDLTLSEGTFVKRGNGWLRSSQALAGFTGTIYIEAGAMEATGPGQFGPASASAGELWILDGASLIVNPLYGECLDYGMQIWNKVHVIGTGFDGKGAIRRILSYNNGNSYLNGGETFKGSMTFEGDATINCGNSASGLGEKMWQSTSGTYHLNGHTLTLAYGGAYKINVGQIYADDEPAAIVMGEGTYSSFFQIQSGFTLYGDSRSSLTVKNMSYLSGYNAKDMTTPWTLNLEDGSAVRLGGSDATDYWKTYAKTRNQWQGPININGKVTFDCNTAPGNMHFSAIGPVHGAGGMYVTRGFLNLFNAQNDFTGPIWLNATSKACRCALAFWDPDAWPAGNMNTIAATNSEVHLATVDSYRLPPLAFHVQANYTNAHFSGIGMGCAPSFRKSGAGDLDITASLMVTGRAELAEGSLLIDSPAIYSTAPGLYESKHRTGLASIPSSVLKAYYTDGTVAETNGVTSYPKMAEHYNKIGPTIQYVEGNWSSNMIARYEGYIWNRNPETTRFGFALAFCAKGKLLIDDQLVFEGQGNWYYLRTNTVELTSGHHKFDLRLYTTTYGDPGARYQPKSDTQDFRFYGEPKDSTTKIVETEVDWHQPNKGFVWKTGDATPICTDYVVPANGLIGGCVGGDGCVFTLDTNTLPCVRSSAVFSNFVCSAGTIVALAKGDQELYVPNLTGVTSLTNGNMRIVESWTLRTGDLAENGILDVNGGLAFEDGAALRLDQSAAHLRRGEYLVARAQSISGAPVYVPVDATARGWRLVSGTDVQGRQTLSLTWAAGSVLSLR